MFVFQSRVADNSLMDRYPLREDFAAAEPALLQAEGRMTEACGPLTRAVVRHLEGRNQSVKQKLKSRAVSMTAKRPHTGLRPCWNSPLAEVGGRPGGP